MPKYRITTDKGTFEVTTAGDEQPAEPVSAAAHFQAGPQAVVDVPDGGSPGSSLPNMLQRMAHPQTDSDVMALMTAPTDLTRGAMENLPTIIRAAKELPGDIVAGAKQGAGTFISAVAHPSDTLDMIAKHLIGSDAPHPMEMEAAKNELAAMRLKLQTARSVVRQADTAKSLPVSTDMQTQAKDMVNALHKATSPSGLLDASGQPLTPTAQVGDFGTKFVQSLKDRIATGGKLSGAQYQVLQRIYKTVFP